MNARTRSQAAIASVAALCLLPATAAAQPVDDVACETSRQYIPNGGYVRTTATFALRRESARSSPNAPRLPGDLVLQGQRRVLVICFTYSNVAPPVETSEIANRLFGPNQAQRRQDPTPTLTQYYKDASYGKLTVTGTVLPRWIVLPKPDTYYEADPTGPRFGELLTSVFTEADQQVDLGEFDNDGVKDSKPNSGDDDGKVDVVFLVHPKAGYETLLPGTERNFRSHSAHYSDARYGIGRPFSSTRSFKKAADGEHDEIGPNNQRVPITIDDYTLQPALAAPLELGEPARLVEVGVFCHEFGHALGLPDLYDRTGASFGIGHFCLMSYGCYGGDGHHTGSPVNLSAWCKEYLGWGIVVEQRETKTLPFEAISDRGLIYRVNVPDTDRREYFLFEYRDKEWEDTAYGARLNWDRYLPGSGVAIWHVDKRVGAGATTWPNTPIGVGQNDHPSLPPDSNSPEPERSLVSLMQCDGLRQLELRINKGDPGDLWVPGSRFCDHPNAGSKAYSGKTTGIVMSQIDLVLKSFLLEIPLPQVGGLPPGAPDGLDLGENASAFELAKLSTAPTEGDHEALKLIGLADSLIDQDGPHRDVAAILADVPDSLLHAAMPKNLLKLQSTLVASRTDAITAASKIETPTEKQLAQLVTAHRTEPEVKVVYGPKRKTVRLLEGLALPADEQDLSKDAEHKVDTVIAPLLGSDLSFAPLASYSTAVVSSSTALVQQFQQVARVGDRKLPIFGATARVIYNDAGVLCEVKSNAVAAKDLRVAPIESEMSMSEAKAIVTRKLGLSTSSTNLFANCKEGVFLIGGDPARARLAYRVCVNIGPSHEPIHVVLDQETRQLLEID